MKNRKMKTISVAALITLSGLGLAGCSVGALSPKVLGKEASAPNSKRDNSPFTLTFEFWGSNFEQKAQQGMADQFMKAFPNVTVKPVIAPSNFQTKINALMAAHQLPDMSYLGGPQAQVWGQEGHIVNMAPYVKKIPALQNWIPETYLHWAPNAYTTLSTLENMSLYYNPTLFRKAKLAYPPAVGDKAWSWPEFVHIAQELTLDNHGLHPYQKGFDPMHITQYGVNIPVTWDLGWYPYLRSAGGHIVNANGTKYTMDSPQAVTAFQDLHDLIWKYHVAPTPTVQSTMPASSIILQTGQYAMTMDGQWNLLDFAQTHLKFGIGVLPKIVTPAVDVFSGATVIYSSSKNIADDIKYLEYESNPLSDLVKEGLWMPVRKQYYTNPKLLNEWTDNAAHPAEYKTAVAAYILKYSVGDPANKIKNFIKIDPIIEQNLDLIWQNKKPVKEVLVSIGKQIQPMLSGIWPDNNQK